MENANNSAHAPLTARYFVAEFQGLWQLRATVAFLFVLYLLLSVAMFNFGGPVASGSGSPCSFGETLYLCAMRALTIGYSNILPTTTVGRIASVSLGALGILAVITVAVAVVLSVDEAIENAGTRR